MYLKRQGTSRMSIQEKARLLMQGHYGFVKHRQQSILKRTGQELGMSSEISNYWNPIQGKLSIVARDMYDRCNVTLS